LKLVIRNIAIQMSRRSRATSTKTRIETAHEVGQIVSTCGSRATSTKTRIETKRGRVHHLHRGGSRATSTKTRIETPWNSKRLLCNSIVFQSDIHENKD